MAKEEKRIKVKFHERILLRIVDMLNKVEWHIRESIFEKYAMSNEDLYRIYRIWSFDEKTGEIVFNKGEES